MSFFSKRPSDYDGLALYVMGPYWRLSVYRGNDRLMAEELFDTQVLANRLREAGIEIDAVELRDGACYISPSPRTGRVMPEGKKIRAMLNQHYSMYRGDKIHWKWDIRQYD